VLNLYSIEGRQASKPPPYLAPISSVIPAELKELPQWVLWKPVLRQGKWTKPPYRVDGRHASCADPSSWADFDAIDAAYRSGGWAGYGFVLTAADPFCGIDLDHVRDPANGAIEAWARDLIRRFDSYTEISPSATGVRIFIKGRLPERGRHKGKIEIYDRSRFLTVTGRRIRDTCA